MQKEEFQKILLKTLWRNTEETKDGNTWFQLNFYEYAVDPFRCIGTIVFSNGMVAISKGKWNGSCIALDGCDLRIFKLNSNCKPDPEWDEAFNYLWDHIFCFYECEGHYIIWEKGKRGKYGED